ncbi:hypothetical protein [Pseudomonas donghuensis]|uniref:hypothetical protein n=1 Tax=Pseudomonas donghuensis TaxID=1163398 RepID=UPI0039E124C3
MKRPNILRRFQEEVILRGAESTLPSNLDDFWLAEIQQSIELYFDDVNGANNDEIGESMSLPLAAVVHLLFAKKGGGEIRASLDEMFEYIECYRIELALEEIRRKTDFKAEPATIATIFTNRHVVIP